MHVSCLLPVLDDRMLSHHAALQEGLLLLVSHFNPNLLAEFPYYYVEFPYFDNHNREPCFRDMAE